MRWSCALLAIAVLIAILGSDSDDLGIGVAIGAVLGLLRYLLTVRGEVPRGELARAPVRARVVGRRRLRLAGLWAAIGGFGAIAGVAHFVTAIGGDFFVPTIVAFALATVVAGVMLLVLVRRWERRHGVRMLRRVSDSDDEGEQPELYAAWGVPVDVQPRA